MTTFNYVVLFVLVLFGSVVPAAAQEGSGAVNALNDWKGVLAIIFVGGGLLWKLYLIERNLKEDSKTAHGKIENNIKESENRVADSVKAVADSVKADVDRLYNLINTLIPMTNRNRKPDA